MQSRTKQKFHSIEAAVARAQGNQSLARFGRTGQDKYNEEDKQHTWLKNVGAKKELQKYINRHYYKYDTKKTYMKSTARQPIMFASKKTQRRKYK
uniref:Uncharacterized protein n=1 Tax=viral metagenome TaxID=1070528 RepID=A0A6C0BB71_9ZZZZ